MNVSLHRVTNIETSTRHHKDWFSCVTITATTESGETSDITFFLPAGETLQTVTTKNTIKEVD